MKVKYIGQDIGVTGLTDGQAYEVVEVDAVSGALRIIDNDKNDFNDNDDPDWKPGYLYDPKKPTSFDSTHTGGRFEIVEDDEAGSLKKAIFG